MHTIAIIAWFATAAGGVTIFAIWAVKGGLRQHDAAMSPPARPPGSAEHGGAGTTNLSHWMVWSHITAAVLGLVVFSFFLARPDDARLGNDGAWLAFGAVVLTAALGLAMARRWSKARTRDREHREPVRPTDLSIPAALVSLHGLAALATVVAVALVALDIGT